MLELPTLSFFATYIFTILYDIALFANTYVLRMNFDSIINKLLSNEKVNKQVHVHTNTMCMHIDSLEFGIVLYLCRTVHMFSPTCHILRSSHQFLSIVNPQQYRSS